VKTFILGHPAYRDEPAVELRLYGVNWAIGDDDFGGDASLAYEVEGGDDDGRQMILRVEWTYRSGEAIK
jgi:hypothetical protein